MGLKKIMKKSVAAFIAISLLYSNCYLCGIGLSKAIAQDIKEPNLNLSLENTKYVQFKDEIVKNLETEIENTEQTEIGNAEQIETEYYSGVAIKTKLELGIEGQETQLPIKSVELLVNMPTLNGYLPERANVVLADTSMSTGEKNNKKINQNYDSNSGLLSLSYQNDEANSNYNRESKDQFEIIYIYQAEAYTGNDEEKVLQFTVNAKATFETENGEITSEKTQGFDLIEKDNKGELLEFSIVKLKDEIFKGFMYSNVEHGTSYDTDFTTASTLCVLDKNVKQQLVMDLREYTFILNDEENTEIPTEGKVSYKSTFISKDEFDKILGQEGVLEIYTGETLLATVKYIEVSDNEETIKKLAVIYSENNIKILTPEEDIKVEYDNSVTSLIIKATNPITEGYINFKNENTLVASDGYGVNVDQIKSIKTVSVINEIEKEVELLLLEPETKISVNSSNVNFSTLQNNKTTLTINLDSTNVSTKLFNNPTIKIKLPEGLVAGNLSSPEIVNGNGLEIESADASENIIIINLEGTQTSYDLTNVSGGASIVMDIEGMDFEDTIPTHNDIIEVTCLQNGEEVKAKQDVNIISKDGLLILNKVQGHNNEEIVTNIDSNVKEIEIADNAERKEIVQEISLVNNYDSNLENFQLIGKIGYSNEDMISNFDTKLTREITVNQEGAQIYYSLNKDAKFNDDSWNEQFNENAKSYKIVLNNSSLLKMESITAKLYMEIPENIGYNKVTVINTEVNYMINSQETNETSTIKFMSPKVEEFKTNLMNTVANYQSTDNLDIEIGTSTTVGKQVIEEGSEVYEGQIIRYNVVLKNNTNRRIDNVNIYSKIKNAVYYELAVVGEASSGPATKYIEASETDLIRNKTIILEPNSTEVLEYQIVVKENVEDVSNFIKIATDDTTLYEKQISNSVKQSELKLKIESEYNEEHLIHSGTEFGFKINVTNLKDKTLRNVKISCELPEILIYDIERLEDYFWYEEKKGFDKIEKLNNTLYWTINSLEAGQTNTIYVRPEVDSLDKNIVKKDIVLVVNAECNRKQYISNDLTKTIYQKDSGLKATIDIDKDINTILKNGDLIVAKISLDNEGSLNLNNVNIDILGAQGLILKGYKDLKTKEEISLNDLESGSISEIKMSANEKRDFIIYLEVNTNGVESNTSRLEIDVNDDFGNSIDFGEIIYKLELSQEEDMPINDNEEVDEDLEEDGALDNDIPVVITPGNTENEDSVIPDDEIEENPSVGDNEGGENPPAGDNEGGENPPVGDNEGGENPPVGDNEGGENPPAEEPEKILLSVSGIAWLDLDKNGIKGDSDKVLTNIPVSLINMDIGNFALDANGNRIKTTTDSQGKYIFNNIPKGSYAVMFEFDTDNYTVTTYQKEGIDGSLNSDAILSTVSIDGQTKKVAITDKIELSSNKENIDLGLIQNAIFDLSLNKEITKITVVDKQGTKTYEYKDGHTAKVDLVAKYMNGANVIVTYKFTVKNEGEVIGYVDRLLDTLPSGLEFSSELNSDWYKDSNGNLYTTALSKAPIKPGESKDIELVLTKTMTEDNVGTFVNNAKLEKISNLENINEKEEKLENNESSAILFISIKTGSIILYIGITLISLAIIGFGTYMINKKVLNREI